MAKEFLLKLDDLTPTNRRLAIATACTMPWRDKEEEIPECYRRDLQKASYDARQEYVSLFNPGYLFEPNKEPISEPLLRQIAPLTPTDRR